MNSENGPELSVLRGFRIGDWLVQPSLNRLTRGSDVVQLEPKAMDLLVFLARHARRVMSQREIVDAVWAEEFVGEGVVRRAITVLRQALGDDANNPTYVETIPKRGYRLITEPVPAWQDAERAGRAEEPAAAAEGRTVQPGDRLSHYQILERIGEGGMGVVYRARDEVLGRDVAVKVLSERVAGDPDRVARFVREARAIAKLSHAHILHIHDFGTENETSYAVTELLEGESLRQALGREGSLPVERALSIARAAAAGLAAAHASGIVHRDVKPGNVFLTSDGDVKILDFGLARSDAETVTDLRAPREGEHDLTSPGVILGTVGYMSPEQARGLPATPASDVFSMGCVLYEMLTGVAPFRRATETDTLSAVLHESPPPLTIGRGVTRRGLEHVLWKALDKNPESRYPTGAELERAIAGLEERLAPPPPLSGRALVRSLASPRVFVPLILVVSLAALLVVRTARHAADVRRVREQVIPEAMRLAGEREFYAAFLLAREAEVVLGDDPKVATLWRDVAVEVPLQVEPAGADLYVRDYRDPETPWIHLGTSPSEGIRVPDGFNRFRLERPGYETVEKAMSALWFVEFTAGLDETGAAPPGMIRIPAARFGGWANNLNLSRYEHLPNPPVGEFLIDRYEVTNASYQRFVDAGGYSNPEYWKHPFRRDGVTLTWEGAMSEFVDETGRPGPATWAYGTFPEGRADYPVTGVSWYEAAAFAEFAGKELPTVYHWAVATNVYYGEFLIPLSNLEGTGLAPVGSYAGSLDSNGLYDAPGNAREWCFNASGEDRFILGGAWNDPVYRFGQGVARAPFERSPGNGFRCMIVRSREDPDPGLWEPLPGIAPRDWSAVEQYSDDVWNTWINLLDPDDRPLDSRIERVDDSPPYWRLEKVSFAPGYDGERMLAYLLLPRNAEPPFRAVVFYNGGAFGLGSSRNGQGLVCMDKIDYIVRAGRAAVYPVYYGTFERGGGGPPRALSEAETLELGIRQYKDLIRTLDYLESRDDIDTDRLAYISFSVGAFPGLVASVLDEGISTLILKSPNIGHEFTYNSALRSTAPVLMVTGRYDEHDDYETVQKPLFNALATPREHKRQVVLECHHGLYPCRREMIPEVLAWLDRYLGPAERVAQ